MKARLALACVSLSLLVVACETTAGGGAGSAGTASPASGASAGSNSSASPGSASRGSASPGSASPSADATSTAGTASNSTTARGDGSADPGVAAKTPAERRADIDGKLDASLGRFDEQLRGEQQRTASERDAKASARADGAAVDAASNGDKEKDGNKGDIQRDRTGDLQSVGVQGKGTGSSETADPSAGPGGDTRQTNGAAGKPIPSGVDDDIVARRLRRAAENETDPELKEKLWKEYRDYKENTQVSK